MFSKKIVAAAALLALAAGAQADVKLYGQVDMSVGSFKSFADADGGKIKSANKVESGVMGTGSYIGFAGSEDLGGGLKALFVLESHIGADTGAAGATYDTESKSGGVNQFWSRSSHVALAGNFGKVALGQYDSPLYSLLTNYSPFGDSQVFAPNQVLHYGSALLSTSNDSPIGSVGQGTSWVNAITYETPSMAGFTATVQYAPRENTNNPSDVDNKNNLGLGASYNAGPLSVSLAHTSTGNNFGFDGVTPYYSANVKTTGLGASYNFGVATLLAELTRSTAKNGGTVDFKTKFYQVGATVPVSANGKVMVVYGQRSFDSDSSFTNSLKFKQFSLGYEQNLSKRTSVYAAAGNLKVSGSDEGSFSVKSTNYVVGIKHNF